MFSITEGHSLKVGNRKIELEKLVSTSDGDAFIIYINGEECSLQKCIDNGIVSCLLMKCYFFCITTKDEEIKLQLKRETGGNVKLMLLKNFPKKEDGDFEVIEEFGNFSEENKAEKREYVNSLVVRFTEENHEKMTALKEGKKIKSINQYINKLVEEN